MTTNQNDIIEAAARMEQNGSDDVINTYQWRYEDASPIQPATTVSDIVTILELIYTIVSALQSTWLVYKDIRITNKTQDTLLGTVPWDTMVAGTLEGDAVPPGVAAYINFSTIIPNVRPSKYFGGFTVGSLDQNGTWDIALVAEMADVADLLLNDMVSQGRAYRYGYLSPKTAAFEIPVSAITGSVGAYQRRRKPGRGS
jgi:hypothetical protein